jgi:hypothetical protein
MPDFFMAYNNLAGRLFAVLDTARSTKNGTLRTDAILFNALGLGDAQALTPQQHAQLMQGLGMLQAALNDVEFQIKQLKPNAALYVRHFDDIRRALAPENMTFLWDQWRQQG